MYRNQNATSDTRVRLLSWSETLLKISSLLSYDLSLTLFAFLRLVQRTYTSNFRLFAIGLQTYDGPLRSGLHERRRQLGASFLGRFVEYAFGYTPLHLIYHTYVNLKKKINIPNLWRNDSQENSTFDSLPSISFRSHRYLVEFLFQIPKLRPSHEPYFQIVSQQSSMDELLIKLHVRELCVFFFFFIKRLFK